MLFFSFFRTLVERNATVTVELKNDLCVTGTLQSVDQFLNLKLANVAVNDPDRYPHLLSVKNCFIRGSVVRYVHLPSMEVDTEMLQDGCRREAKQATGKA
eukprot:gnl/MRDRNA2_/MRDRNA2_101071_c0_seq1.p2 gnl/MRDRNA2_/MRDRNA2_101071_c0~~gnl/MRDRNA2_/MRDRNA2_101071_c0_seq1.p2  ORF type:complete len:100 (+),score=16.60 gnl/MRDRNA2_/MRDRNA2_101071_c0_seq1:145-444(+)